MRTSTRLPAWAISVGTHAALAVALVLGVARRHVDTPPLLQPLVWVEPEPPRAGPVDGGVDVASEPPVAPPIVAEPPPIPSVENAPHPPAIAKPLATVKRPPSAAALPPRPSAPAVSEPATAPGNPLGTEGAASSGVVGGLGDAPLALRDVAAPPELLDRVLPDYPARARTLKVEGQVVLEVVLDRNGRVEDAIQVTRSIALLDAAAVAAVRQWRFRPARSADGTPVRVRMEIPVRFVLH